MERIGFDRTLARPLAQLRAGGIVSSPFATQGASRVQSTDYAALARLHRRDGIRIDTTDVLVDVGCGRGARDQLVAQPRMAEQDGGAGAGSRRGRRDGRAHGRVCERGDPLRGRGGAHPPEGTFFYLYNPFDGAVMRRFAEALAARAARPEALRILYFNCRHLDVFRGDPRWIVYPLDSGEPAALIRLARSPR